MINNPEVFVSQEQLSVAQRFIHTIKDHDFENATNIDDALVVLDKLYIQFGYTIGCYNEVCRGDSSYVLYPHKINANLEFVPEYVDEDVIHKIKPRPIKLYKEIIPFDFNPDYKIVGDQEISLSKYLPSIYRYINVPYTKEGIWQLYLLHLATDYFPLGWHRNYRRKYRIFSLDDIDTIKEIDCSCYRNDSILPVVYFIDSERAVVECSYFNDWCGLCKECGYSVESSSLGHYTLMGGEIYNFKCGNCKDVVDILYTGIADEPYGGPCCPNCGKRENLSMWNPIECCCPHCGGKMELDKDAPVILAD